MSYSKAEIIQSCLLLSILKKRHRIEKVKQLRLLSAGSSSQNGEKAAPLVEAVVEKPFSPNNLSLTPGFAVLNGYNSTVVAQSNTAVSKKMTDAGRSLRRSFEQGPLALSTPLPETTVRGPVKPGYTSNLHLRRRLLKTATTVTGFKKFLYNSVKVSQNQLYPGYNRRKYNHSHYNQILKENTRLNRVYAYLSKTHVLNYSASALKTSHLKNRPTLQIYNRPIPRMVSFLESRLDVLLWRNQFTGSIQSARAKIRRGLFVNGGLQKKASFRSIPGDVFSFV